MQVLADALRTAQRVYYLANGKYAQKFEELDIQLPAGATITPFGDTEQATYSNNMKAFLFINSEGSYVRSDKYGIGIHSLFKGWHKCQSYTEMADQVCLSLGGKYISTACGTAENLAAGYHGCNIYTFE